jgi:uncharacterized membrane protein YcaP (DUF421 family)
VERIVELALGIGEEARDLAFWQMALRAILVYLAVLLIVRLGKKRFMSRATAFDVIVGIILGSVASRAITGNAPLLPTLTATAVIMALHWLFSAMAVRADWFGSAIKGHSRMLVKDGKVDQEALCAAHMTDRDLAEALREKGVAAPEEAAEARLERSGNVSAIKRKPEPRIVSVDVEPGVQTVRLELD